jgi:hypothetical protein
MYDHIEETPEFRFIPKLAEALRDEFGVAIDAHPGGVGSEAGAINRTYRASARVVLGELVRPDDDPAAVLTRVLRLSVSVGKGTTFSVHPGQSWRQLSVRPKCPSL